MCNVYMKIDLNFEVGQGFLDHICDVAELIIIHNIV